ncbi:assimilatory sulfite reductase (NADPH) flavoprotein subunit [Sporosarcina sp. ACRSM]|uniref:assimilatory sulfite reductase (NADPH) flavoprotein subunit n=1 Tax=Sporosarcina sp. ACRSM TaxID=2918216 RepID=UPI001EF6FEB4|nr:assimilatory sulfite reductase (NADPH) flavoprotein subunit [Sporosarcina sp. ACRSM]MCG7334548.1 assimilatory sulfite reductase (NADPH) flavoprotein subunit [Sporosarcina sp. ACRSM]
MTLQVINSPFNEEQVQLLNLLLPKLTEPQKIWLGGYLSAYQPMNAQIAASDVAVGEIHASVMQTEVARKEVTILYGSQTGNGQALAESLSKNLLAEDFHVSLFSMHEFKLNSLKKIENLLLVVSTHGEGDPPDNALPFYEFLFGKRAPKLDHLQYSVLALGDSSYEFFCHTGKQFDERLQELGAKRLTPRVDCDLDYDEPYEEWSNQVLENLKERLGSAVAPSSQVAVGPGATQQSSYSRSKPFQAEVLENIDLNGRGSNKETRHLELSLEGSNLEYEPGDSLGIYPTNDEKLVDELIAAAKWNPEETVHVNKQGERRALREALISHFEITVLTKPLLQKFANLINHPKLVELVASENDQALKEYIDGRDLLDLVQDFGPFNIPVNEFVALLRKIPARLYSIASSSKANPDEVHLTIGAVRYETYGRERKGVCSVQCAERLEPGSTVPVYIQRNDNFKLPDNPDTPIIMIGPGTGIAPFRSFMEEREEIGAEGKSWLFFGDQHYVTDFLYQIEWQRWLKDGVLTKMDVAFSRDTDEKVYVQHRMLEQSEEIYRWLEEGAVVYICGDEKNMAADVHTTLETILQEEGALNAKEAADYLADMQKQKRYQRDVY